jgi:transposase
MSKEPKVVSLAGLTAAAQYGLMLGIESPWKVAAGELDLGGRKLGLEIRHEGGMVPCPKCGGLCRIHDHAPERRWRHLDVMQFETVLRARVPRADCPEHGVLTLEVPWAGPKSRFTLMFEAFAIEVLRASRSVNEGARLLDLDWGSAHAIMQAAVERGMNLRKLEGIRYVGLDEKSFGRGQDYVSVMTDVSGRRVLEVEQGRGKEQVVELWNTLPAKQLEAVEAAAMDMGADFAAGTRQAAPKAVIVHDRFHVSKLLNETVDKVRKEEHRRLREKGDESLTGTKFLWLQGFAPEGEKEESFEQLCQRNLRTARAWAYKETFNEFWHCRSAEEGARFFKNWAREAKSKRLPALTKVVKTLEKHLVGLLSYFVHPITNALTEGFNSIIQSLKSNARGFRSFANYRTRILFFCGKLDLSVEPDCVAATH